MKPERSTERRENEATGTEASRPGEIPKRGWKEILSRTKDQISEDHVDMVAGGIAFYTLLSIPFLLTAVVSIYGMVSDPAQIGQQMSGLKGFLPSGAESLISGQLTQVAGQSGGTLSITLIGSILLALWSGSKAVKALITALNIAYEEDEKRGFVKLNLTSILLTLAGVVGAAIAIGLVVGVPAVIGSLGLAKVTEVLSQVLRWPLLAAFALFGLAVLYRYAPSREKPVWRWVSWGSVAAGVLWLICSALFSWYVSSFGNYNKTYGALGGVIITLMWFYISAYVVMIGAELNSEMERQTSKDTTTGKPVPLGKRGAKMADTVARGKAA